MADQPRVTGVGRYVQDTARRLVPGAGAPEIGLLHDGLINRSFLVLRDGREFVLRVPVRREAPGIRALSISMDRHWELRVLRAAAAAGIAPAVLACEPGSGILVTARVEGQEWSAEQALRAESQAAVATLLRRVHELDPAGPARHMTVGGWCELYRQAIATMNLPEADLAAVERAQTGVAAALRGYSQLAPAAMRLCHSDLHRLNLLQSVEGHWLVDWEYAHMGDPFWDLAGWVRSAGLSGPACEALVNGYLGREPLPAEQERLHCLLQIHDFICLLWDILAHP